MTPVRRAALTLRALESEGRVARSALRTFLVDADTPAARAADATLVMAELVANGHAACSGVAPVVIEVAASPGLVVVQVTNERLPGTPDHLQLPRAQMPRPTEDRGRGLPLVALLCARLAMDHGDGTTTVRAELVW
jgi:anti-sigma regulatory factor (Ser/Thr protein kinase)